MSVPTLERPASPPLPPASDGRRNRPTLALALGATALLATIALTIALLATGAFDRSNPAAAVTRTGSTGSGLDAAALYAGAAPGVVDITAHSTTTTAAGPFGLPRKAQATDTGTGTVLDTQGRILTADHVIAGASSIAVTLQNGATRPAKLLGGDSATDTAVLKIDASGLTLHPLLLGSLATLHIGDPIAVIGDPFSFQRTLSSGLISGLDRTIEAPNGFTIAHALQTDAAMNPGNSGGPVLDAHGRVIGVADQIATGNSGADSSTGVGFAVPIDIVKTVLPQLQRGATPAHAFLGVGAADATGTGGNAGALVQTVRSSGPAAAAGIRTGDVIVAREQLVRGEVAAARCQRERSTATIPAVPREVPVGARVRSIVTDVVDPSSGVAERATEPAPELGEAPRPLGIVGGDLDRSCGLVGHREGAVDRGRCRQADLDTAPAVNYKLTDGGTP